LALLWYALLLAILGRDEESLRASIRAQTVEPLFPAAHTVVGRSHYYARRFDEAERVFRAVLEMEPGYVPTYLALARLYMAMGRLEEALPTLERAVQSIGGKPPLVIAMIGGVHARMGRVSNAFEALEQLRRERSSFHVPIIYDAVITGGLGNVDDSLQVLEQACEERSGWLPFLCREPLWDAFRGHPRFTAVLRRVGCSAAS
jgi:tetratricopeptide (TPR) repeat protein